MSASPAGTTVVITGAGVISPLGDEPGAVHAALLAGRSAIGPTSFDTDGVGERMAAEIHGFEPAAYLGAANLRPLDRPARLASSAAPAFRVSRSRRCSARSSNGFRSSGRCV